MEAEHHLQEKFMNHYIQDFQDIVKTYILLSMNTVACPVFILAGAESDQFKKKLEGGSLTPPPTTPYQ